jgi:hypothetical protein
MGFLSVVSDILHVGDEVAPEVASALFSPAAGALVSMVLNGVTSAEQSGNTVEQTVQDLLPAATGIVNTVLQAKGASVNIDPGQLSSALSQLAGALSTLASSVTPVASTSSAPASTGSAAAASA